jgi:GLPGLI family protein
MTVKILIMKQSIIIFSLFFLSPYAKCQEAIYLEDSCLVKCFYNFLSHPDTSNLTKVNEDLMTLEVGSKTSLFYSHYRRMGDSLLESDLLKGISNNQDNNSKYFMSASASSIAKNFPDGKITYTDRITLYHYKYSEPLVSQDWQIHKDTMTLSGIKCQKATAKYRGREYEAWFAKEIPITYGPWKFYGLPGLIVKVFDSRKHFTYQLVSIENNLNKSPMKMYHASTMFNDNQYIELSRVKFNELKKLSYEDPIGFMEMNSGSFDMKVDMTPEERKAKQTPFNPLEIE